MSERSRLLPELEALAQGVPWPVIASAADSQIAYANPAWFAYTRDGDTGGSYERWLDAIHEQDLPTTRRLWLRATRQGSTFEHRFRLLRADGKYYWHLARGWPIASVEPAGSHWMIWLENIHQATHLQATLARREREFQTLVENAPDGIVRFDRRLRCKYVNNALRHMLGSGLVRLESLALAEFPLPSDTITQWQRVLDQVIESRMLQTAELTLAGPDGERTLACRAAPEPADGQRVESVLCVLRETTEERRALAAMTASEQRFRQLTDRMDDAFWLARRAPPKLLHVNPAAQRLLGVPPQQLLADPAQWRELVHPEDRDGYVDPCRLPDGEMDREYRVCRPDGSEIWVRDRRFLIDEQLGVLAGIAEDITARRERDRLRELHLAQAQQAKAQAEALARAKDEFLAVVSHELRSPLNAIRGWTHVLRQSPSGSTAFAQALAAIERNSALQLTLIEELLDSARVVAGKLLIEPQPTRLDAVIDHAVQAILPTAQARGVTIRVEHDAELDWVEIDGVRFEQVVGNLLSNAVKFTPSGGQVDVRSRARGEMFEIVVRDTGAGINPAFLPHVFDRFRQADSSSTRRTGGLGLGLFLAREIVELHGGRLEVHSEGAGHGAQFTVNAPVGRVQRFRSGSRNEPSDASG